MSSRNKKPYLFALQVIVMALLLPTALAPAVNGNDDDDDDRRDFGRRIAGAYLADFNPTGRGLLNLMADGNVIA